MGLWLPNQKPPRGTQLNRTHPLARNLVLAVVYNEVSGDVVWNYAGPRAQWIASNNSPTRAIMPEFGTGKDYNASGRLDSFDPNIASPGTGDIAVVAGIYRYETTTNNFPTVFNVNTYDPQFYTTTGGQLRVYDGAILSTNAVVPKEIPSVASWIRRSGVLYGGVDGVEGGITAAWTAAFPSPIDKLYIGCSATSPEYFDGIISFLYFWDRSLSLAELAWVSREPYAMFQRRTWNISVFGVVAATTTAAPTTLAPTTIAPTPAPTTLAPTTVAPTTPAPTTLAPTPAPTTLAPTTVAPTTLAPTTLAPTTLAPTTLAPTTLPPTAAPTTLPPTTLAPTTLAPTTLAPTTVAPTTLAPTTVAPTTVAPTTLAPTTLAPTTVAPTTVAPTTLAPTTLAPTTVVPPTTLAPTTLPPVATTPPPTTYPIPTTLAPTTLAPTTLAPTTLTPPTTLAPTTLAPTTLAPTTIAPTLAPTTVAPTTLAPTTLPPTAAPTTPAAARAELRFRTDANPLPIFIQSRIFMETTLAVKQGSILLGFVKPGEYYGAYVNAPTANLYRWIEVSWT